jgi:putative ABC transport system permease protein
MIEDYLKFAIDGIKHRRLRSWLTMIGIFIGIIAIVSLISLGQGLQAFIDEQFEKVGGNRIIISPGGGGFAAGSSPMTSELTSAKLDESDLSVVKKVRGVEHAVGILGSISQVKFKGKVEYIPILAFPNDAETLKLIKKIDFFIVEKGRYLKEKDKYKAILGYEIAKNKFEKELKVGDKLEIEEKEFEVVGINKKSGNPFHDSRLLISFDTAKELFGKEDEFSSILVEVKEDFLAREVADDIKKKLRRHRHVKEGEEDFSVSTSEQIVGAFKNVLSLVQSFLVGIAAISLIVGGIGIMTTMYTSILERTKQIGIMKAIGARNSDILLLFLIESGMLGLVGGIIGVTLGMGLSFSVEYLLHMYGIELIKVYISPELILGALAFSFGVGCLSGILPARKAALMNPVDALRY